MGCGISTSVTWEIGDLGQEDGTLKFTHHSSSPGNPSCLSSLPWGPLLHPVRLRTTSMGKGSPALGSSLQGAEEHLMSSSITSPEFLAHISPDILSFTDWLGFQEGFREVPGICLPRCHLVSPVLGLQTTQPHSSLMWFWECKLHSSCGE